MLEGMRATRRHSVLASKLENLTFSGLTLLHRSYCIAPRTRNCSGLTIVGCAPNLLPGEINLAAFVDFAGGQTTHR